MSGCMVGGGAVARQASAADICPHGLPAARAVQHGGPFPGRPGARRQGRPARGAHGRGHAQLSRDPGAGESVRSRPHRGGRRPRAARDDRAPRRTGVRGCAVRNAKIGAVVVMVNPELKPEAIAYFYGYTRAQVVVAHPDTVGAFRIAAHGARHLKTILVVGELELDERLARAPAALDTFPSHRDDAAIWLFSGGTTGQPKAVVQTHTSFANTAECYAKGVIGYTERDVTLSVPKLYFGYATGSNLLFPFSVGAATALFPEAATADVLFQK